MLRKRVAILHLVCIVFFTVCVQHRISSQSSQKSFVPIPPPSWIKKYPKPKLKKSFDYTDDLYLIHSETQYNHELGESYYRYFYYLRTIEGVNNIQSYYLEYEPDYEEVFVNDIIIHRNNKKIPLNTQLQIQNVITEKQIGGVRYDIDGKLSIFFDRTKVGDLVEITFTQKGFQPDLQGVLSFRVYESENLKGRRFTRVLSAKNKPFQYKLLNSSKKPKLTTSNGITTLEWIFDQYEVPKKTDIPSWYDSSTLLSIIDVNSFQEYYDLNFLNYRLDEVPSDKAEKKVQELIREHPTKEAQINSILNYIQGEIEYLDYEKIEPKRPDLVLQQGFGDCKSMTLLAIKMLETIGVESWPVIVNSEGVDDKWNDLHFINNINHVVLEFVYQKDTILFDATKDLQKGSLYQKYHSDFKYGVRVLKDNNQLTPLPHHHYSHKTVEATIVAEEDTGIKFKSLQMIFEGDIANKMNHIYNEYGIKSVYKNSQNDLTDDFRDNVKFRSHQLVLNYESQDDAPKSVLTIETDTPSEDLFSSKYGSDPGIFTPDGIKINLDIVESYRLGKYFALPNFDQITQTYKFIHPAADSVQENTVELKNDWIYFSKKVERIRDTLTAKYHLKMLKSDLEADRHNEVSKVLDSIKDQLLHIRFEKSKRNFSRDYIVLDQPNPTPRYLFFAGIGVIITLFIWFVSSRRKKKKQQSS